MAYEGVGPRIRERLLAQGYKRESGEADVTRFSWDFRFNQNHLHAWLRDEMTPFKDLIRLCTALDCSAEWLLTGEERGKAKPRLGRGKARGLLLVLSAAAGLLWPSGSGQAQTLQAGEEASLSPPYRKWRRFRNDFVGMGSGIAYAA